MRAFIAVESNEGITRELARIQRELKPHHGGITWVSPEHMHLTLKFFKEIAPGRVESLKDTLAQFASTEEPFSVTLGAAGCFPDVRRPKVLWVGFNVGKERLDALYCRLEDTLSRLGFEKESRGFHPHLTLGRIKSPGAHTLAETLFQTKVEPLVLEVSGLSFFQSTLTPQGPVYTLLSHSAFR